MKRMTEEEGIAEIRRMAAEVRRIAGEAYGVELFEGDLPDPVGIRDPQEYWEKAHVVAIARAQVQREAPPSKATPSADGKVWLDWAKEKAAKERDKKISETTSPDELFNIYFEEKRAEEEEEKTAKEKAEAEALAQAVAERRREPSPLEGITDSNELFEIHQRQQELLAEQGKGGGEESES